jgi:hypothetical protein
MYRTMVVRYVESALNNGIKEFCSDYDIRRVWKITKG